MYYYAMSGIKICFPLEGNKEVIPDNLDNAKYLYVVEIRDGNPRKEEWCPFNKIASCKMDVFIVWAISADVKKQLKDKGVLILQTEVRNYKEALLGYVTGLRRFKPL